MRPAELTADVPEHVLSKCGANEYVLQCPATGVVLNQWLQVGQVLQRDTTLAVIENDGIVISCCDVDDTEFPNVKRFTAVMEPVDFRDGLKWSILSSFLTYVSSVFACTCYG